jgi:uncharacterized membrane protein HdeD (DUF308 family)
MPSSTAAAPLRTGSDRLADQRARGRRFIAVGVALVVLGLAGVVLSEAATIATGWLLGTAVAIGGAIVVVQALRDREFKGFSWQLLFGSVEIVGGILIVMKPMKGAAAVTLLVVIVMVAQAVTQAGLAFRIWPARGWWWLLLASIATLLGASGLLLRFPYSGVDQPGEMAGIAMMIAGLAFLLMGGGWLRIEKERPS